MSIDSGLTENLLLVCDISTKLRYYLGMTNLEPGQDTGEEAYIIDISKLYEVVAGDPANLPISMDWAIATDWMDKLLLTIYMACILGDGRELSLETGLYSLNANINELIQLTDTFY